MADKLRDSPFFGDRVINFTQDILNSRRRLDPITEFEKKLLKRQETIKELNKELDGQLVTLLKEAKEYITPPTALRILLHFKKLGRTKEGHKIVHYSARDRLVLTEEEINELVRELTKDPDASVDLWLAVLAEEAPEETTPMQRPGLNLPVDFK